MLKPFKSPIILSCQIDTCTKGFKKNMEASCLNCESVDANIIDLDNKKIASKKVKKSKKIEDIEEKQTDVRV